MRAIPERLRDVSCGGELQIDITFTFTFNRMTKVVSISEQGITSPSTHFRSFQNGAFPVSQLVLTN